MSVCLRVSVNVHVYVHVYVHVHVHVPVPVACCLCLLPVPVPVQPGCSHTRAGSFQEGVVPVKAGGHTDELVQRCWRAANDKRKGMGQYTYTLYFQ